MKFAFYLVLFFTFTDQARADRVLRHEESCRSIEEKGHCQILIKSEPLVAQGQCEGFINGDIPCFIAYQSDLEEARVALMCGVNLKEPELSQEVRAQAVTYQVNLLIKTEAGAYKLHSDEKSYKLISSNLVEIFLDENRPEVAINLGTNSIKLSEVSCQ